MRHFFIFLQIAGNLSDLMGTGSRNDSLADTLNNTEDSPGVWNKVVELVVLALVSTLGTMGNIFVISSIIVIPLLKTKGNAFVVSLAIADLLVTSLIIPASCVAILAGSHKGQSSREYYCNFQWQVRQNLFLSIINPFSK